MIGQVLCMLGALMWIYLIVGTAFQRRDGDDL